MKIYVNDFLLGAFVAMALQRVLESDWPAAIVNTVFALMEAFIIHFDSKMKR